MKPIVLVLVLLLLVISNLSGAGGDTFATATRIMSLPMNDNGFTYDLDDSNGNGCPDAIYHINSPWDLSNFSVSLSGSTFDTYLRIYAENQQTVLWQNDDYSGSQSSALYGLYLNANTNYYILIEGYYSYSVGYYVIQVNASWQGSIVAPDPISNRAPASGTTNVPITGTTLTWNFGNYTTNYTLYFSASNPPQTEVVSYATAGATGSYTTGALAYNTTYYWRVMSYNGTISTLSPPYSFSTPSGPPGDNFDTALQVTNLPFSESSTTLYFTDSNGNGGRDVIYRISSVVTLPDFEVVLSSSIFDTVLRIYASDSQTILWENDNIGAGTNSAIQGITLLANTNYYIMVDGIGTYHYGAYSIAMDSNYSGSLLVYNGPHPVTNMLPATGTTEVSASGTRLSWNFGANTSTYTVQFGPNDPPQTNVVSNAAAGASGSYSTGPLAYNTTYYWRVITHRPSYPDMYSSIYSFTTAHDPNTTQWRLELRDTGGSGWNGGWISLWVNDIIAVDYVTLSSGYGPANYYFWVAANDEIETYYAAGIWASENEYRIYNSLNQLIYTSGANGQTPTSTASPIIAVQDLYAPPVFTSPISPANTATGLPFSGTLSFSPSGNATGYFLSFGSNNPPTNLVYLSNLVGSTSYNYYSLAGNTTYYWQVIPYNEYGSASNCPVWSFTTYSQVPAPTTFVAPANGAVNQSYSVQLSWNSVVWSEGYYLSFGTNNPPSNVLDMSWRSTNLSYTANNLLPNTTYYWKVTPYNSNGNATNCPVWSFTTASNYPYSQNFNSGTSMPTHWVSNRFNISASHGYSGNGLYALVNPSNSIANVITGSIGAISANTKLQLRYRIVSSSGYPSNSYQFGNGEKLEFLASNNGVDYQLLKTIDSSNHIPSTSFVLTSALLSVAKYFAAGDMVRIKIVATADEGNFYVDLDDLELLNTTTEAVFNLEPSEKDFGVVSVGSYNSQVFLITNLGVAPLMISSVSLSSYGGVFALMDANAYPVSLSAGQAISVAVRFSPVAEGEYSTALQVVDALGKTLHSVDISGIGSDANNYGGGDAESTAGGYFFANNLSIGAPSAPVFSWVETAENILSDTTLDSGDADDGFWGPLNIGFSFPFYGTLYSQFYLSTNGLITFGSGGSVPTNSAIPVSGSPNSFIALFWDNLEFYPGSSTVTYEQMGSSFVVTMQNMSKSGTVFNPANSITIQAILFVDGSIKLQYQSISGNYTPTIGIENGDGSKGIEYHFNGRGGPYTTNAKDGVAVVFGDDPATLPITLSSFTAILNSNQQVNIAWIVETETENAGYNLLRNEVRQLVTAQKINDGLIDAGSEFGTQIQYSYTDMEVDEGATFFYWLESVTLNGESEFFGPITVAVSGEGSSPEIPNLPLITELYSAFPNPFNPATNLLYSLKEDGLVRLEIYNQKGQKVKSFDSYHDKAGVYKQAWDGRDWQGNPVASGVYFYKLICGSYSATKKMILLK